MPLQWPKLQITWWRHQMETFSASLAIGAGNSPVTGEFPAHTKASDAELWCFLWSAPWINGWVNIREAGDLRRHRAHYDVIVMLALRDENSPAIGGFLSSGMSIGIYLSYIYLILSTLPSHKGPVMRKSLSCYDITMSILDAGDLWFPHIKGQLCACKAFPCHDVIISLLVICRHRYISVNHNDHSIVSLWLKYTRLN